MKRVGPAFAILAAAIGSAALAATPGAGLAGLAGVYKHRFQNGSVNGGAYTSENVLEIVPTGLDRAYVRAHLEFYNGHLCAISGVAHAEGPALVYRPKMGIPAERACVLSIAARGSALRMDDGQGSCSAYCGARGGFSGIEFPIRSRRPIRYTSRLEASPQYRAAIAEDRAQPASR